jgi:hypothetical protein
MQVALAKVIQALHDADSTGDSGWIEILVQQIRGFPVWDLKLMDPRKFTNFFIPETESDQEELEILAGNLEQTLPIVAVPSKQGQGKFDIIDGAHRAAAGLLAGKETQVFVPATKTKSSNLPELRPERTAISRSKPSRPAQWLAGILRGPDRTGRILDFGAGFGKDTEWLQGLGYSVDCYEPSAPVRCPLPTESGVYELVMSNYVLNVLVPGARLGMLRAAWSFVAPRGGLFVAARNDVTENIGKGWERFLDGWVTTKDTFQRDFTDDEIAELMSKLPGAEVSTPYSGSEFSAALAVKEL